MKTDFAKGAYGLLLLSLLLAQLPACQRTKQEPAENHEEVLSPRDSTPPIQKRINEDEVGGYEEVITQAQQAPSRRDSAFREGMVGDVQLLRVFADGFNQLGARDRLLAYHLARAALAGRDIASEQISHRGLDARHMTECILKENQVKEPAVEAELLKYMHLLGIHLSYYDRLSGKKFLPGVTFEQFDAAAHVAYAAGGPMGLNRGESLEERLEGLRPWLFDKTKGPRRCALTGLTNRSSLRDCSLNLYRGVSLRELRNFEERFPFNSRLARIGGKLVEDIYRTGDKRTQIPPGRYSEELGRVIGRLHDATRVAGRGERRILADLVEHFSSGDPFAFDSAMRNWQKLDAGIEFHLGFSDRSLDPRGVKGVYSGVVGLVDKAGTSRLDTLLRQIPYFEGRMPWSREYRRKWPSLPKVKSVQALVGTGSAGPICQMAFSLRPDWESGERSAGKVLIFSNVIESMRRAVVVPAMKEFLPAGRRERDLDHLRDVYGMRVAIREVMGRYLGQTDSKFFKRLRGMGLVLQELKAELVALWLMDDPKLVELGLVSGSAAFEVALDQLLVEGLVAESLGTFNSQRPQEMARRALLRYLVERSGGIAFEEVDGKIYPQVSDIKVVREAIRKLLLRCERIMAEGDRVSALRLLERYKAAPSWPELTQVAERAKAAKLGRLNACIMPKLRPLSGPGGRYKDASVSHKESLHRQLMRYSRY